MRRFVTACFILLLAANTFAALPGFSLQKLASTEGFVTSMALNSKGSIYYSVRSGEIYELRGTTSVLIARVDTANVGNEALLGIAFRSDQEILAHYVLPDESGDVIGSIALPTAKVTEVARFICDGGRVCGNEHHGGNISVAADGYAYFGIGDYGGNVASQIPDSPGGKVFRISPSNEVTRYAMGMRNPFDLFFDTASGWLVVGDNGAIGGDEIHLIHEGDNAGWPYTYGTQPPVAGMVPPNFVFPTTTAPTGMLRLNGKGFLRSGMLVGAFVTKGLHYFPQVTAPAGGWSILTGDAGPVLDVAQAEDGTIYVASGGAIYRLNVPKVGDCNGDGLVDQRDNGALSHEILDGDGDVTFDDQQGGYPGSWGCDANQDGFVDARDLIALTKIREGRNRPTVHPK